MAAASDVVAVARRTLQDYDSDRHSDADLLKHVNASRRALAVVMPKAYAIRATLTLAAGAAQTLPADCALFYGLLSTSAGTAITPTEAEYLDAIEPGWRSATAGATVHYCYDERSPSSFDVYPPASAAAEVTASYSQKPTDLELGGALNKDEDLLQRALADFTIAMALFEDVESPVNINRAMVHLQAFASMTGANFQNLVKLAPNNAVIGGRAPKSETGQ